MADTAGRICSCCSGKSGIPVSAVSSETPLPPPQRPRGAATAASGLSGFPLPFQFTGFTGKAGGLRGVTLVSLRYGGGACLCAHWRA